MTEVTLVLATSTGGVGAHVASLVRGLSQHGWRVRVCGPQATEDLFGFARAGAVFTPVHISGAPRDPLTVAMLRRVSEGSALLHAHGLRAATVAAMTRRHPFVVTWHNAVLAPRLRQRVLAVGERYVARSADISLCVSPDLERRVRALGGRDVRPGPVAAPVREPERFPTEVRAELGIAAGAPLVLSVGRLHPQKGHDVLIGAAAILHRRWPQLRVAIAGDGPQRAELTALVAAQRAPVMLLGRRADIPDLLRAADVLVSASVWEGSPLSLQEALRAGRPVVATRVGGVAELVGAGAELVASGDPVALAEAIDRILCDPAWAATLAARAGEVARRLPGEGDTVAQVEATYRELIGASR